MSSETRLNTVTYNAARARFEALVNLTDDTGHYTYDCDYEAGLDTPAPVVATALVAQARRRHAGASAEAPRGFRMVRRAAGVAPLRAQRGQSLVQSLLGNFEALFGPRAA